jgi:hypothetical protein
VSGFCGFKVICSKFLKLTFSFYHVYSYGGNGGLSSVAHDACIGRECFYSCDSPHECLSLNKE